MNELEVELVASPHIYFGVADESLLLFDPRDRRLHVLNNTAAMTWALTDQPTTALNILDSLATHFEVPVSQIEDEVLSVLGQLIETGLCVVGDVNSSPKLRQKLTSSNPDFEAKPHSLGPYRALGALAVVDVEDTRLNTELERVLLPLLDPLAEPASSDRLLHYRIQRSGDGFNLSVNGETLARGTSRATCKRSVLSSLNSRPIDFIDDAIVMHAAGVEIDGRIIAFPGKSNSGKSTLATRLLSRGAGYLSDEALPVAMSDLSVGTYHKSLCLDDGAQRIFPMLNPETPTAVADTTWDVDPAQIGRGTFSRGGAIGALVFPAYKVGSAEAILEPLDRTEVARRLLANTFDFVALGQPGFAVLVRMANRIPGFSLTHGGRGEVDLVEQLASTLEPGALAHKEEKSKSDEVAAESA